MRSVTLTFNFYSGKLPESDVRLVVKEVLTENVEPQLLEGEKIELHSLRMGRLHNSNMAFVVIDLTYDDMYFGDTNEFKRWLSSLFADKVSEIERSREENQGNIPSLSNGPESPLNGIGGLLAGLMDGNIPDNIKDVIDGIKDVTDDYKENKEFYDKHVHYQILLEATESFDREFVKQLGELTKLDGHAFDTGCRNCVTTLMSYFTINNNTNWPDLYFFIKDIKESLAYELQSNCGFRDDEKERVAAKHMQIVHQNLYDKLMVALEKIEFEINVSRGVLPPANTNEADEDEAEELEVL